MYDTPRAQQAFPASFSSSVYLFLAKIVESAIASGGVIPPAITAAIIGEGCPTTSVPTAKVYAALFTGPPISKACIRPKTIPSIAAFEPLSEFNHTSKAVFAHVIGFPTK